MQGYPAFHVPSACVRLRVPGGSAWTTARSHHPGAGPGPVLSGCIRAEAPPPGAQLEGQRRAQVRAHRRCRSRRNGLGNYRRWFHNDRCWRHDNGRWFHHHRRWSLHNRSRFKHCRRRSGSYRSWLHNRGRERSRFNNRRRRGGDGRLKRWCHRGGRGQRRRDGTGFRGHWSTAMAWRCQSESALQWSSESA